MSVVAELFSCLPDGLRRELFCVAKSREGGVATFSEIHVAVGRRSSVVSLSERIFLTTEITPSDMQRTVVALCNGSVYAHRDTMAEGYISLGSGVRVGLCGQARYERGRLVGVSDVTSLVIRIPTVASSLINELWRAWKSAERGMLVYSAAGAGKTTALRTLAPRIAVEERARVAVIDERCEFSGDECCRYGIMLFRGYKRADGMEIALRTMTPDVLVVDEIGSSAESSAMLESLNSGVRLLATAHGVSVASLLHRGGVRPFLDNCVFDVFFGIFHTDGVYSSKTERIQA